MTDNSTVSERLIQLIADNTKLSADDISTELHLESSGLDSFARIELVLVIEEAFDIELSDSESANIQTVQDIADLIVSKTAA